MAVIILGSGLTPVIGTREFCPIPGGSGSGVGGGVSISSGDTNNYVITSTGIGDDIQGEPNLTFNGSVLSLTGNLTMPSGNISVINMTAGATIAVLNYDTSVGSGLITYNDSGGGTVNFLRADGTWAAPAGTGITISGTPANNQVAVWTSASDIEGATAFTWDGSELYTSGSLRIDGSVIYNPGMVNSASAYVVHYNPGDGSLSYTGSGVSTEYLNGNGAWTVPSGSVDIIGSPVAGDVTFFYDSDTIEGSSLLRFDSGILHVESGVETQIITELNSGYGIRLPDNVYIGRDVLSNSPLTVGALSGSNPLIYIANAASGYGLQIDATSAVTAQQNILADVATNTITRGLDILHTTSNISAAGFGTGLTLSTEYDSGANQISAAIDTIITDPVYASGDANLSIKLNSANTLEERFVFDSTGIFQTDTINELTASAGVTIEGVLIEDSDITLATANYLNFNVGTTTNIYDNSGVMTFTDTVTGPVTLATLATATGDVTKVGTPVDWQIGVWTGDGTIEGLTEFTWDSNNKRFRVGDYGTPAYYQIAIGGFHPSITLVANGHPSQTFISYHNDTDMRGHIDFQKQGGTEASPTAVPSNAEVGAFLYQVYDGTSSINAGKVIFQVDGAVATDDFDTKYTWDLKEGVSASALMLTLGIDGLEYAADHSTDQAANPRWIVDKDYVDTEVAAAGGLSASGTPANDQIGVWTNASTLEGTANLTFISTTLDINNTITVDVINEHTTDAGVTIETIVLENGGIIVPDLTGTGTRLVYASTAGLLEDGNLSGQVTTTNSLATALGVTAITDQTAIGAALISTDELLVNDNGTGLRRMDVSVLETYMQDNLSFGTGYAVISGTPANNRLAIWTTSTDIEGDANLTWDGSHLIITGSAQTTSALTVGGSIQIGGTQVVDTIETVLTNDDTHLATSGAVYDAIAASGDVSWGTETAAQPIVYGGSGGDIDSSTNFTYTTTTGGVIINSATGASLGINHNSNPRVLITANASSVNFTSPLACYIASTHATTPQIGFGDYVTTSLITVRDASNTQDSILKVFNASTTLVFDIYETGAIYAPELGSDDTEDHVIAIDDSTGLLTKRSVASIGGDVTKVGAPVDNQVGVWTGNGTLEGDADLTWTGTTLTAGTPSTAPSWKIAVTSATATTSLSDTNCTDLKSVYSNINTYGSTNHYWRYGGTFAANTAAPTNATIKSNVYEAYDGSSRIVAGFETMQIDGAVATGDFDVKYEWSLREGVSAAALKLTLDGSGLTAVDEITGQRIMKVIEAQVLYTNTSQTTIINLPANAVIWDVQVEVRTAFTGSGTDLLDIGITGTANRYEDDLVVSAIGFGTMSLTNVPDRMTGSTNITFQYIDQNSDAGAGEAYVYIHYSLH